MVPAPHLQRGADQHSTNVSIKESQKAAVHAARIIEDLLLFSMIMMPHAVL